MVEAEGTIVKPYIDYQTFNLYKAPPGTPYLLLIYLQGVPKKCCTTAAGHELWLPIRRTIA